MQTHALLLSQHSAWRILWWFTLVQKEIICILFAELDWLVHHIKEKRTIHNQSNCVLQHHEWHCLLGELFDDETWETCLLSQGIMWATQLSYNDLSLKFLATLQEQNCAVFSRRGESTSRRDLFCPEYHCMGVTFLDIWYIVNWGPARSLLDQHQEAGRAGRDGLPSHVLII